MATMIEKVGQGSQPWRAGVAVRPVNGRESAIRRFVILMREAFRVICAGWQFDARVRRGLFEISLMHAGLALFQQIGIPLLTGFATWLVTKKFFYVRYEHDPEKVAILILILLVAYLFYDLVSKMLLEYRREVSVVRYYRVGLWARLLRALMSRRREVSRRHGKTLEEVHENAIPVFQTGRKDLLPILEGLHRDPFFALFSIFIACGFWFTDLRELVYIIAARYVWELWITFRTDSVLKSELAEWQKKENVACEYEIAACKDSSAETGRACIRHTFDFLRSWSEVHPKRARFENLIRDGIATLFTGAVIIVVTWKMAIGSIEPHEWIAYVGLAIGATAPLDVVYRLLREFQDRRERLYLLSVLIEYDFGILTKSVDSE